VVYSEPLSPITSSQIKEKLMTTKIVAQCSIEKCNASSLAKTLCSRHYQQMQYQIRKVASNRPICSIKGCGRWKRYAQWCGMHFRRWQKTGNPLLGKQGAYGDTKETRFWSKVGITSNIDKCWEWQGKLRNDGYAEIAVQSITGQRGRYWLVHQYAWYITYGVKPTMLLHSCDNRKCVNPNHLREGNHKDNYNDMVARGRASIEWQLQQKRVNNSA